MKYGVKQCMLLLAAVISMPHAWAGELQVSGAWVRLAPAVADATAAYMSLYNGGDLPLVITGVDSDAADSTMLHGVRMQGGVMQMFHIGELTVPAHGAVRFAPRGKHVMLMGLKRPLEPGETVHFVLQLAGGGVVRFSAPVRDQRQQDHPPH